MKRSVFMVLAFCFMVSISNAQQETLFGNGKITHGGYGGPELKVTQFNDDWGLAFGGRGGWIINSAFSIGGGGYGIVTKHTVDYDYSKDPNADIRLNVGYGGLFLEYINSSNRVVHFTVNALIGAGGASYGVYDEDDRWDNYDDIKESSPFFVLEPGITAEVNVFKFFRISAGVSYRWASGAELFNTDGTLLTDDNDISGMSANICFKFGSF